MHNGASKRSRVVTELQRCILNDHQREKLRIECYFVFLHCVARSSLRQFDYALGHLFDAFGSAASYQTIMRSLPSKSWEDDFSLSIALEPIGGRHIRSVRRAALGIRVKEELLGLRVSCKWLSRVLDRSPRSSGKVLGGGMSASWAFRSHVEMAIKQLKESILSRLKNRIIKDQDRVKKLRQDIADGLPLISSEIASLRQDLRELARLEASEREQKLREEEAACVAYEQEQQQRAEAAVVREQKKRAIVEAMRKEATGMSPTPLASEILSNANRAFVVWLREHPTWDLPEPDGKSVPVRVNDARERSTRAIGNVV